MWQNSKVFLSLSVVRKSSEAFKKMVDDTTVKSTVLGVRKVDSVRDPATSHIYNFEQIMLNLPSVIIK